jgi:hypothetical protein
MSASDRQLGNDEDNELILDHQARYVILLSCYLDVEVTVERGPDYYTLNSSSYFNLRHN